MSASEKIARLRELRKKAELSRPTMLTWEREIVDALPALLDVAEALDFVLSANGEQLHTAFEQAHAALQALAEGGGE